MANNRMWLVNKKTKEKILIAKYYPTTQWYVYHDDIKTRLNELFDKSEDYSTWGKHEWELEYEMEE